MLTLKLAKKQIPVPEYTYLIVLFGLVLKQIILVIVIIN